MRTKRFLFNVCLAGVVGLLSRVTQAQFTFLTNRDSIIITGYSGAGVVSVPNTTNGYPVSSIGDYAFNNCPRVTSINFGTNIVSIGIYAFEFCSALSSLKIPVGVTSIPEGTCFACSGMTNIVIPDSVTNIAAEAFYACGFTSLTIPGSITSVGNDAFVECSSMTNIVLADGIISLGDSAFQGCSLRSVTIPSSLTSLGSTPFFGCNNLKSINVSPNNPAFSSLNGVLFNAGQTALVEYPPGLAGNYPISNGVTAIGTNAFASSSSLDGVEIPSSVTNIGSSAFYGCPSLEAITVSEQNPSYSSANGVLFDKTFARLIAYPGGRNGSYIIPNSVTNVGDEAFYDISGLTSIVIPDGVVSVGSAAFSGCSSLTNITLGGGLTSIGDFMFYNCMQLTSVTIPKQIISLWSSAFAYCNNLTTVYCEGDPPVTDLSALEGDNNAIVYYFPDTIGWEQTFSSCPTALCQVPTVPLDASPTNGAAPLGVYLSSANMDSSGGAITNWNWTFGDGSTSTLQNPTHIYTNNGPFYPSLVATSQNGSRVVGYGPSILVGFLGGLLLNGGFETGDFTDWGGDRDGAFVVSNVSAYVHSGQFGAQLGPPGVLGHLSQTLPTTGGKGYQVSFWLDSSDGQAPNEFTVSWNGSVVYDEMDLPAIGWTNVQLLVTASGKSSVLDFGFRDDPGYLGLDDISVVPLLDIGGFSFSGTTLLLDGVNGVSGGTNYLLMSTNLSEPVSRWNRVATNVLTANGSFTLAVTNALSSTFQQQFYRLQSP